MKSSLKKIKSFLTCYMYLKRGSKMKKIITISVFMLFIQGCATTYQSTGLTGGYSETQLDENVFKVSFHGNGHTGRERVTDFTILRSAELILEHGYKYFIIIDSNN